MVKELYNTEELQSRKSLQNIVDTIFCKKEYG